MKSASTKLTVTPATMMMSCCLSVSTTNSQVGQASSSALCPKLCLSCQDLAVGPWQKHPIPYSVSLPLGLKLKSFSTPLSNAKVEEDEELLYPHAKELRSQHMASLMKQNKQRDCKNELEVESRIFPFGFIRDYALLIYYIFLQLRSIAEAILSASASVCV